MSGETKSKTALLASQSMSRIISRLSCHNAFSYFVTYDIAEIRSECLKKIEEGIMRENFHQYHADWAEDCITQLLDLSDDLWERVLSWYIFAAGNDYVSRAINFAISLAKASSYHWIRAEYPVSKMVMGRLSKNYWVDYGKLFEVVPTLQTYLIECLEKILSLHRGCASNPQHEYQDSNWVMTNRALTVMAHWPVDCLPLLPNLNRLIELHRSKALVPYQSNSDPFHLIRGRQNLLILTETRRIMLQAQKEQAMSV